MDSSYHLLYSASAVDILFQRKIIFAEKAKNVLWICIVFSFLPLLLGIEFFSFVGLLISLSLIAEIVLLLKLLDKS